MRDLLQQPDDKDRLKQRLADALLGKAAGHRLHENNSGDLRHLAELGG